MAHEYNDLKEKVNEFLSGYEDKNGIVNKVGNLRDIAKFSFYCLSGFKKDYINRLVDIRKFVEIFKRLARK